MNLDFYCERLTDQFWAEPVNAITNLSFLLAGLWGLWKNKKNFNIWTFVLSLLSLCVGVGSFLFHTFANKATHLLDLIPIFIFTLTFIYFTFYKVLNQKINRAAILSVLFVALMVLIELFVPKSVLNGSLLYFPALVTLGIVGLLIQKSKPQIAKLYFLSSVIFLASLIFRTIDAQVCESFGLGTHFLWHLLNGGMLAIMILITQK